MGRTSQSQFCRSFSLLLKEPGIKACAGQAGNQAEEHAPERLDKVVALLMIGLVHMLRSGKPDGLHVGEEHPVQEETVVPVDEKPHPVTDRESLPKTFDSRQP